MNADQTTTLFSTNYTTEKVLGWFQSDLIILAVIIIINFALLFFYMRLEVNLKALYKNQLTRIRNIFRPRKKGEDPTVTPLVQNPKEAITFKKGLMD